MDHMVCLKLDIVSSRTVAYADWLAGLMSQLSSRSIDYIIEPTRRAGDEVFMLLPDMASAWKAIRTIYQQLLESDYQIYLGIGRGEVEPAGGDSEAVDGPAIWRAADALAELKQPGESYILSQLAQDALRYNIKVSQDERHNDYHQQHLYFMLSLMQSRTRLQQAASDLKFFYPDYSNQQYARLLYGDDPGPHGEVNFSKHLMRGRHKLLEELERSWIAYFDQAVTA